MKRVIFIFFKSAAFVLLLIFFVLFPWCRSKEQYSSGLMLQSWWSRLWRSFSGLLWIKTFNEIYLFIFLCITVSVWLILRDGDGSWILWESFWKVSLRFRRFLRIFHKKPSLSVTWTLTIFSLYSSLSITLLGLRTCGCHCISISIIRVFFSWWNIHSIRHFPFCFFEYYIIPFLIMIRVLIFNIGFLFFFRT